MEDLYSFLVDRLSQRAASILLGAGFSAGAKNKARNLLPVGFALSEKLYDHFFVECPWNTDPAYINSVSKNKDNLQKICSILRSENRQDVRDKYLTNMFSGCLPGEKQYQKKIKNYDWNTIFTLNIDDLVENIFSTSNTKLCVWNNNKRGERDPQTQTLIKLHGDVNFPEGGYVFDDDEYSKFLADSNCLLKEFAHVFFERDMVILGSEFHENDISFILNIHETSGYQNNDCHYFFVLPAIHDIVLKNKIENTDNFHWIKMNTEEFLAFISDNVVRVESNRNLMKEQGAIFVDEFSAQENYISQLYLGHPVQYNDFFGQWDIQYPAQCSLIKTVEYKKESVAIITVFGKPYSGKTTIAKRCLIDLKEKGYVAIEITRMDYRACVCLLEYLHILPSKTKVAILIENAAYQYEHIISFIEKNLGDIDHCIDHLIVITTDTIQNHQGKSHNLLNLPRGIGWYNLEVSEEVTNDYVGKIFYTLCVKKRLNNYLKLCPPGTRPTDSANMSRITSEMKKANDIIDVLYYSSEGKYFKDYYANWLKMHRNAYYDDYLYVLSGLGKLGISSIPVSIISTLVPGKASKFKAEEFAEHYPDIVEIKSGNVKLLRSRLIYAAFEPQKNDKLKDAIYQLVKYTIGLFYEGDESEAYELFQKALRVKHIRHHSLLPIEKIEELFVALENICSRISYYWIQYGLIQQYRKSFEDANNSFLYAKNIRPNSYQVAHALAKNRMEIGLDDLKKLRTTADENFQQGRREMEEIINNPNFSRAFSYSVHSYATMLMRYYNEKKQTIPAEYCRALSDYFKNLIEGQIDIHTKEVIVQFYRYCETNKIERFCSGLEKIWDITPCITSDENNDIDE